MAYLPISEFERQKQLQEQSGQPVLSGQGSVLNSSTPTKGTGPSKSGQFVNLQSYLNTNKDQATDISNKIADTIKTSAQDTRDSIQNADSQFKNTIQNNSISNLDSAKDEATNIVNQAKVVQPANPITSQNLSRFKEIGTAQYKGPSSLDETELYQPLQSKVQKIQDYDSLSKTDEGRFELLNQMFASQRPTYNRGQKLLDNLLLSGSEVGKQKLDEARQSLQGINTDFENLQNQSRQLAQNTKSKIDDARNFATQYLTDSQVARNQEVDNRLQNAEANWANEYNDYVNLLKNYSGGALELNQTQADKLGVTNDTRIYNMLKGIQPESYLTLNEFDSNKAVTKEEQAQLAALDLLAKQVNLNELSKYKNADLAGTLTDSLDASRFKEEVKARQDYFDNYSKTTNVNASGRYSSEDEGQKWTSPYSSTAILNSLINDHLTNKAPSVQYVAGPGGEISGDRTVAYSRAQDSLLSQINQLLAEQGYSNQVKIK